jgi:hypothetical protein
MAGLVLAIHVFSCFESPKKKEVDARHKAGHDEICSYVITFDGSQGPAQDNVKIPAMAQDLLNHNHQRGTG